MMSLKEELNLILFENPHLIAPVLKIALRLLDEVCAQNQVDQIPCLNIQ